MIRRPPRSTQSRSSAASDVYKRQKLFKAAAEAETVHALNHLRVTGQVKSTLENLGTAVSGETYEFKKMYPDFIAEAKKEGNKAAALSFDYANQVEQIHACLLYTSPSPR